jgi:tetratricopeptide (TPR) repeat protein
MVGATAPAPAPKAEAPRTPLPSDFPAALGSLDEPDLPVVSAGLPARAAEANLPAAKRPPPRPVPKVSRPPVAKPAAPAPPQNLARFGEVDTNLPAVAAGLPVARSGPAKPLPSPTPFDFDLPVPAADLPAPKHSGHADLPSLAADLPSPAASLPMVAAHLPSPAAALPSPAAGLPIVSARGFGEIDLPVVAPSPPPVPPSDQPMPRRAPETTAGAATFGEIELPRDTSSVAPPPPPMPGASVAGVTSADFVDLELNEKPRSRGRVSVRPSAPPSDANRTGGVSFGEVDLTSEHGDEGGTSSISVVAPLPRSTEGAVSPGVMAPIAAAPAAATAQVRSAQQAPALDRAALGLPKRSLGRILTLSGVIAVLLGGAALQLTSYGAFGYLYAADRFNAAEYEAATVAVMGATEKSLSGDTYDTTNSAMEATAAAHERAPRAKPLAAYAAIVDSVTAVRFGPDGHRASRAKQLLADLPAADSVKYRDIAVAALAAANEDFDKARAGLEAASKRDPSDPIQVEVALLRGNVELAAKDAAAALGAFKHALALSSDARAHFGLARAYDLLGDAAGARKEISATLDASPQHPGALTLRARMKSAPTEEAQALKDLAAVLEGPARAKAAPSELSRAYAARAWLSLERGSASEAREAFAQAVNLDPHNAAAISGEGRLLLNDGRYTEALARFDALLQIEPSSPEAVADDAEAKIALERLADAKKQLLEARTRFPKSLSILRLLGKVEQHLGNNDAAEADLRAAVEMSEPSQRDAVLPYVALSELLASRGRVAEAKAVLDQAKKTLAPSAALDRALGEVAELQGEHDVAVVQYRAAIAKDPRDLASHFRLALTLRRMRKFDEAGAELDRVAAVDKDYPGLALERGLLFEEAGDVEKAIDQFKAALARAPDDPDLQLRVGSAYVAIGRPDDAMPMLRKVLQGRSTSAEAHHYLGRALMLKGPSQQAEALRFLRRAVDLDPNRAEFHVYLAWAANEATPAQLELARDEIDRALALDKLNAESYWQKGVLERMEGAIEDAIRDERRALELRPSRYEAHATLAECYEDRNDEPTAMTEWAKAVGPELEASGPDGVVRHPYWLYKYGKLLLQRGNTAAALSLLLPAAKTVEKSEQRPGWLAPLQFSTGQALAKAGRKAEAVEHYRRFMDLAPVTSPDRPEAQEQLKRLGAR